MRKISEFLSERTLCVSQIYCAEYTTCLNMCYNAKRTDSSTK